LGFFIGVRVGLGQGFKRAHFLIQDRQQLLEVADAGFLGWFYSKNK
jgi:hypothetical protein